MRLAAFDILPLDDPINFMLSLEPTDPINEKFEGVGFESKYFLNNMGSLMLVIMMYPLGLIV